ncbi:MAG: hypothetical protein PHG54_13860 [Smithellaceae bacterium]|nr:hypothetical protein [Syntrophaceae bacterium]MDD4242508.1 hypothetical protein [Smithellaceae bacterium]
MNLSETNFPRRLEADGSAEKIREVLAARQIKLSPQGRLEVPMLAWTEALARAIAKARLQGRVRLGFEEIAQKLAAEEKGFAALRQKTPELQQDRISRLLLFSSDGAERLYRHIEQILAEHAPRVLGCRLDMDGKKLGEAVFGKNAAVKVILVEHKDAVSDVLSALIAKEA